MFFIDTAFGKINAMNTLTSTELLRETTLTATDAARLILECAETLGEKAQNLPRRELINLVRRAIHEGCRALELKENTVSFETAAWQSVDARAGRRPTTRRDLRHYVRRMLKVNNVGAKPLRCISANECREILQTAFGNSASSYKKGRAILHSIFAYGIRREWADCNPVDKIEIPQIQEKLITPLTPEESRQLLSTTNRDAHREMAFSVHLMLYCGIRPTEVQRLQPNDIDWQQNKIIIRPRSSKTGGGRLVSLHGWKDAGNAFIPANWQRRWNNLRKDAGFRNWIPDICRHTFASYHAAYFKDLSTLQLEMGHRDLTLLRTRYMTPVSAVHAASFWNGLHTPAPGNELPPRNCHSQSSSISNMPPNNSALKALPSSTGLRRSAAESMARRVKSSSG